jgi:hypothetical protein
MKVYTEISDRWFDLAAEDLLIDTAAVVAATEPIELRAETRSCADLRDIGKKSPPGS